MHKSAYSGGIDFTQYFKEKRLDVKRQHRLQPGERNNRRP